MTLRELIEELIRAEDCLSDFEHPVVFDVAKKAIVIQVVDDDPIHVRLDTKGEPNPGDAKGKRCPQCGGNHLDED